VIVDSFVSRWLKAGIDERLSYSALRISRLYVNACPDRGTIVHAPGCRFDARGNNLGCTEECSAYAQREIGCSELEALEASLQCLDVREVMRRTDVGNELASLLAIGHGAIAESLATGRAIWPELRWFGDVTLPVC
jgi:hypothetical protein